MSAPKSLDQDDIARQGEVIFAELADARAAEAPSDRLSTAATGLAAACVRHGYDEASLQAQTAIESLQAFGAEELQFASQYGVPSGAAGDLVRCLFLGEALPERQLVAVFGADVLEALKAAHVFTHAAAQRWQCRVTVFPVDGQWFATDPRYVTGDGEYVTDFSDAVMFIGGDSVSLLHATERAPNADVLDVCCGSGVQALSAARWARSVVGVDISPRAVRFSRFNALLNGCANARFEQSDLCSAVGDRRFDVITSNPPFVPWALAEHTLRYRYGGHSGEEVLQRLFEQTSGLLREGGSLYVVSYLFDIESYDRKLAGWWRGGPADLLVLHEPPIHPLTFAKWHAERRHGEAVYREQLDRWLEVLRVDGGFRSFSRGLLVATRAGAPVEIACERVMMIDASRPLQLAIARHFANRRALRSERRNELRVAVAPGTAIARTTWVDDGTVASDSCRLWSSDGCFSVPVSVDGPAATALQALAHRNERWSDVAGALSDATLEDLAITGYIELTA